jgi:hypothetical protein
LWRTQLPARAVGRGCPSENFRQHGIFIVLESGALPVRYFGGDLLKKGMFHVALGATATTGNSKKKKART